MQYRVAIGFLAFSALGWTQQNTDRAQFFETRIRPILANNCYSCHTDKKSGGLRVDSRAALLGGGDSGPAIIPGRPDESLLIRAVSHTSPELKMPMGGEKLKDAQIADLRYWNELDKGGHFAAFEQPGLFTEEVRAAFRAFR